MALGLLSRSPFDGAKSVTLAETCCSVRDSGLIYSIFSICSNDTTTCSVPQLTACNVTFLSREYSEYVGVCIGSCVGEKKREWCMWVNISSSSTYLPLQKSCIYSFHRRNLRGELPTPPLAIFSFLFCLASFAISKFAHTILLCTYLVTPTKPVRANHALVSRSDRANLAEIHVWLGGLVEQTQAYDRLSMNPVLLFDSNT